MEFMLNFKSAFKNSGGNVSEIKRDKRFTKKIRLPY